VGGWVGEQQQQGGAMWALKPGDGAGVVNPYNTNTIQLMPPSDGNSPKPPPTHIHTSTHTLHTCPPGPPHLVPGDVAVEGPHPGVVRHKP
jgi:hypothetical protein